MKKSRLAISVLELGLLFMVLFGANDARSQTWTVLAFDAKGDGKDSSLADAAQLSYRYEKDGDYLWFRATVYGTVNEQAFGVNIVLDTGADDTTKVNWWGGNKAFRFDRLITAWVTRVNGAYQGTIGVGDAAGVNAKQFNNLIQNNLLIQVAGDSILIRVKRSDLTDKTKFNLIAAVGSNESWNDDIPNTGFATIDLAAERPKRGLRELDLTLNNLQFAENYKTLPKDERPPVSKTGQGKQNVILIPGMYSRSSSFENFMARNQSRYRLYLLTPPGIDGTPARQMPPADSSYGDLAWTRAVEADILNLIEREKITKPVIVAERYPASNAAIALSLKHRDKIAGLVLIGTNFLPPFPSLRDPTRQTFMTLAQRVSSIDEGTAQKWFKYVTPETWLSNNYLPEWYSADPSEGQQAWREIEAAPLPIKIRYLCEFWSSDVTEDFKKLEIPVMVLVPGFDEQFLANPANSFAKTSFLDGWNQPALKRPNIEVVTIPGARLMLLDNQPKLTDETIAKFVERVNGNE